MTPAGVKGALVRAQNVLTTFLQVFHMEGVNASYKVYLFEVTQGWDSAVRQQHTETTYKSHSAECNQSYRAE